jgi:hypothetical protein
MGFMVNASNNLYTIYGLLKDVKNDIVVRGALLNVLTSWP